MLSSVPPADSSPDDPRAPSQAVWETLTPAERAQWCARLGPMPFEAMPPVGDPHIEAEREVEDALGRWFRRRGLKAYIGRGLTVYYPEEQRFAPDLFVVLDVEPGRRTTWIVSHEKRGLDFALEIHFAGDRSKDLVRNREWFACLGIPEYFVYDVGRRHVVGWRLETPGSPYVPIVPQLGRWRSDVLQLELGLAEGRLRFFYADARLPLSAEIQAALEEALVAAEERAAQEIARAEERVAQQAERVAALEAENAALRARLAALSAADPEV